jgi:hypothetical protein
VVTLFEAAAVAVGTVVVDVPGMDAADCAHTGAPVVANMTNDTADIACNDGRVRACPTRNLEENMMKPYKILTEAES